MYNPARLKNASFKWNNATCHWCREIFNAKVALVQQHLYKESKFK